MSLNFEDIIPDTKTSIEYKDEWTSTEVTSIQTNSSVSYNYSSIDDFLAALGLTSETTTIEDEDSLAAIQENINNLSGNCNFYLTSSSSYQVEGANYTTTSYIYNYSYDTITSSTVYGNKITTYYLNLKAVADEGEDTNVIQVEKEDSNSVVETNVQSSVLSLTLTINYQEEKEEDEEPQEVEVVTSEYGSFPSGTSADYCVLLLHTDEDYVQTRGISQSDLDSWAIDYLTKLNDYALDEDESPYEIATSYYGYDSSVQQYYVLVEKTSTDEELESEWESLHGTTYDLQNNIVVSNEKDCYKVYVAGWCQLVGFDDTTLISDQGGSTERKFYSYPNGYYILVGDELRLFILDKIAKVDYELDSTSCTWYPVTDPDSGEVLSLTSRKTFGEGNYYFYMGKRITEADVFNFPIVHSDTSAIIQNAADLRLVLISNSVLELETFSAIANPTNGLLLSNNLTAIGRYSFGSGGSSIVRIFSRVIEYIGEQAFPATANTRIIMCRESEYDSISSNTNSYIDLPATVTYIGLKAFCGLYIGILNESKCTSLSYVGAQAFASESTLKTIYLAYSTLDINDTGELIYLPDNISYEVGTHTANLSQYNNSGSNSDKSYSVERATLGTSLSGYTIYIT